MAWLRKCCEALRMRCKMEFSYELPDFMVVNRGNAGATKIVLGIKIPDNSGRDHPWR